jgi:hypothetical protein
MDKKTLQQDKMDDIKKEQLTFQANSLNDEVSDNLSESEQMAVAIIGREISQNGLSATEACKVANISYGAFKHKYESNATFRKVIDFKKLQYKREMMRTVNASIRNGDTREAAKMLERIFPDEYGGKNADTLNESILADAIEFVREHSDIDPLVGEGSGKGGKKIKRSERDYNAELDKLLT